MMSSRMKKSVLNLLLKLSSGWRPKNRNVDSASERFSQIVKQLKVEGRYVVCSVEIKKEFMYIQVLKVWDILPLEEIPKLVKRFDSIFTMFTDDFINRCKEKCLEGDLEIPKSWAASCDIIRYKTRSGNEFGTDVSDNPGDGRIYVENSKVSESLLLMKFYSLSSGVVNHLLSDRDGRELDLPLDVTDEQMDIILFDKSSFILGRSGTGKTTVLTMKLFQQEQSHYIASEGFYAAETSTARDVKQRNESVDCIEENKGTLRQHFVTVSSKLCYAVKQEVSQLKSSSMRRTIRWLQYALKKQDTQPGKKWPRLLGSKLMLTVCMVQMLKSLAVILGKLQKFMSLSGNRGLLLNVFLTWGSMKELLALTGGMGMLTSRVQKSSQSDGAKRSPATHARIQTKCTPLCWPADIMP